MWVNLPVPLGHMGIGHLKRGAIFIPWLWCDIRIPKGSPDPPSLAQTHKAVGELPSFATSKVYGEFQTTHQQKFDTSGIKSNSPANLTGI